MLILDSSTSFDDRAMQVRASLWKWTRINPEDFFVEKGDPVVLAYVSILLSRENIRFFTKFVLDIVVCFL